MIIKHTNPKQDLVLKLRCLSKQDYNLTTNLESRQKTIHFQKKWNLKRSPDEPVQSLWRCKNWDFGVAKKFRNREQKPPSPMCRSRNSTPKQKKLLAKRSPYEEDIAVWKPLLLLFFLNCSHTSKNQMALDFASDVWFGWNKIWSGGFLMC